jgi:hypothetical protein
MLFWYEPPQKSAKSVLSKFQNKIKKEEKSK